MKQQWQRYADRFEAMAKREKVLLLLSVMAVVYLIWDSALLGPALAREQLLSNTAATQQQQIAALRQEQALLSLSARVDPDARQKETLETLSDQLRQLDEELSTLSVGLVPAAQMPQILRDVLQGTGELTLLGMETMPVEQLQLAQGPPAGAGVEAVTSGVYKHTVVLTLSGSYFRVLDYLSALENLTWRFYWARLDYAVDSYPSGRVEVHVYTLSSERGMLGG